MLSNLTRYAAPIIESCLLFPLIAAIFTLPFMVLNYRKYGGIALMRVIVVYSFILYSMCAFLLTVLPLPSREAVAAMAPRPIGWVPFTDLMVGLQKTGVTDAFFDLGCWRRFLLSSDCFQILANVVMQIPLGFYLRYYFRCGWRKTLLIGLGVSLFYEVTQYTGLYFIYPHAYRYASVDDLITNTLGALIGWWLTPLPAHFLPSREEIDRISYRKGEHLTLIRRTLAAMLDMMLMGCVSLGSFGVIPLLYGDTTVTVSVPGGLIFLTYFVLIPYLTHGRTPGQWLLRLRVVQEDGARPKLLQLFARNVLLYIVEPAMVFVAAMMLLGLVITLTAEGLDLIVSALLLGGCTLVLALIAWFFLRCQFRWNAFPHGHFSHTRVAQENRKRT